MKIDSFSGKHRFLSNFFPAVIPFDGAMYPTVEHAFQAAKTHGPGERATVRNCMTPGDAKKAGRRVTLRSDWEEIKVDVMGSMLRQKFAAEPLRGQLLATGDADLVEGNTWGDRFWGVCNGVGENWLGRLLMQVRAELR